MATRGERNQATRRPQRNVRRVAGALLCLAAALASAATIVLAPADPAMGAPAPTPTTETPRVAFPAPTATATSATATPSSVPGSTSPGTTFPAQVPPDEASPRANGLATGTPTTTSGTPLPPSRTVTATPTRTEAPATTTSDIKPRAVPNPLVDLVMAPRTSSVLGTNQEADVDIIARAGTQNVTAGAFYLDFDPKVVQVVSFGAPTGGGSNPFPIGLLASIDNVAGQARYDAGANFGSPGPSGYFRVATVRVKPAAEAITAGARTVTTLSLSRTASRPSSLTGYVGPELSELLRDASGITLGINPSASAPAIVATPVPVTLQSGIDTAITVTAADWTNAPLSGATYAVTSTGTSAILTSPACGTTTSGGLASFAVRTSSTSGTAVIDVAITSPNLPGGIVVLSRLVTFTSASRTATPTTVGAVATTAPACPTAIPTATATATRTSTATPTATPTSTATSTATRTAVAGGATSTTVTRSLSPGWNAVSLTVDPAGALFASGTCTALDAASGSGTAVEIGRWIAGAWDSHRCGVAANDFALLPGTGYAIQLTRAAVWATTGKALSAPAGYRLTPGWNLVGPGWVPVGATADWLFTDATNQAVGIGQVTDAVRVRAGSYDPTIKVVNANRFALEAGTAYFLRVVP